MRHFVIVSHGYNGDAANLQGWSRRAAGGPRPNRGCKASKAGVGGALVTRGGLEGLSALRE